MKRSLFDRVSLPLTGAFILWTALSGPARAGEVRSSISESLSIYGFSNLRFSDITSDEVGGVETNPEGSFYNAAFDLAFSFSLYPDARFFGEFMFDHANFINTGGGVSAAPADAQGVMGRGRHYWSTTADLLRAYVELDVKHPWLTVRLGQFFTPADFYNTTHVATPTYPFILFPQYIVAGYIPIATRGAWFSGRYSGAVPISYDAWTGSSSNLINVQGGGRVMAEIPVAALDRFDVFVSGSVDQLSFGKDGGGEERVDVRDFGAGLRLEKYVNLEGGYFLQDGDMDLSRNALYGEAYYLILEKLAPFFRYERLDQDEVAGLGIPETTTDIFQAGVAYYFKPNMALKAAYDFQDADNKKMDAMDRETKSVHVAVSVGF